MACTCQTNNNDSHLLLTRRRAKAYVLQARSLLITTLIFLSTPGPNLADTEVDNPYFRFGKEIHCKYLGFGTMGSVFFTRNLITENLVQAANEDNSDKSLSRMKESIQKRR
jgi:hypothetical protein